MQQNANSTKFDCVTVTLMEFSVTFATSIFCLIATELIYNGNSMTVTFYANFEPKISVERGADLQIYRGGIFKFFVDRFLGFDENDSPSASRSLKRPYFDKKLIATGKFLKNSRS